MCSYVYTYTHTDIDRGRWREGDGEVRCSVELADSRPACFFAAITVSIGCTGYTRAGCVLAGFDLVSHPRTYVNGTF